MGLMEGADVYQIAKNCRAIVKMIEDFYASHIKNMEEHGRGFGRQCAPEQAEADAEEEQWRTKTAFNPALIARLGFSLALSHSMASITRVCGRGGIWKKQGT